MPALRDVCGLTSWILQGPEHQVLEELGLGWVPGLVVMQTELLLMEISVLQV